jgi:hypothetical protein
MFASDLSGLEQAGIVIGALAGAGSLALATYSAVSTHRQRRAQRATDVAIGELRRSQAEALERLAMIEEQRRAEELEDRFVHQQAALAADLRASLHATNQGLVYGLRLWNRGPAAAEQVGWAATSLGAEVVDDPLNGSLILKPDEDHVARVRARITPADVTLSWTDQSGGRTERAFRGLSPRE